MRRKMFQKAICFILSVTTMLGSLGITASAGRYKEDNPNIPSLEDMQAVAGVVPYETYLKAYAGFGTGSNQQTIVLSGNKVDNGGHIIDAGSSYPVAGSSLDYQNWPGYTEGVGAGDVPVYLPADDSHGTTWQVKIDKEAVGFYYIKIEYYSCTTSESSTTNIERQFLIDGKVPFSEVSTITLNKFWKYANIEVSEPVDTDEADAETTEYKHITNDKDGKPGYYKIVTSIKNGKKTVTTYTLTQDVNGNSMAPSMSAEPSWGTYYLSDSTGYYDGYFGFYMSEGTRKITLVAEREPVVIKSITLEPVDPSVGGGAVIVAPDYADIKQQYINANATAPVGGSIVKIEGEFPDMVSDTSVAPTSDKSSAATYPQSSKSDVYNVIGEQSYNTVGQWAAYKFKVNKSGLYKLGMRFKQDALQGMYICRTLKLSGHKEGAAEGSLGYYGLADGTATVPFKEAYDVRLNYSKDWQSTYIADEDSGEAYQFYFEEGVEYTMYLECSLGSLKDYIKRVETVLNTSNDAYLRIIQLTGPSPDASMADSYNFKGVMPDVLVTLLKNAKELETVKLELEELCGTSGAHIATLETIMRSLNDMGSNDGLNIPDNLSTFKTYLGTLGTWVNDSKKGTLMLDSVQVIPSNEDESALLRAKPNFFVSLWAEITSFFYSFFTNYEQMGLTVIPEEGAETVDVWLAKGRDQSSIWRKMVDAKTGFTGKTGIAVQLKLVANGTLLPSILSGKGPDVYMELLASDVINYAIRGAIIPTYEDPDTTTERITYDEDVNDVFKTANNTYKNEATGAFSDQPADGYQLSFESKPYDQAINIHNDDPTDDLYTQAAMDTITLAGRTYGVPMTMTFAMMFYRMDVLADIGAELPDTWEDMLSMLPQLQANNMEIGVNYISALDFMIYQLGGSMWKYTNENIYDENKYDVADAGAKIGLDENTALQAFDFTCSLYTKHSFSVTYDAANRFRTGEMPILIGDYITLYNNLVVFATELDGLWSFCSLPGSVRNIEGAYTTEEYNYDSLATVSATVILHGCDNLLGAWKFTQWQTSAEVQAQYGNGMVAIIGPSAKYEAANMDAINNLSWSAAEKRAIYDQLEHMSSIVNYPGSYIINRYTKFAFLDAVNEGADPVTAMREYIVAINEEIKRKREEFNLPVYPNEEMEEPTPVGKKDPPTTSQ